jgi:hypothetical protein
MAHEGRGHTFVGVPVARCVHEGCKESRTWGPSINVTHPFTQIGGGAVWYSEPIPAPTDPTMGEYADEVEADPVRSE